MTDDAATTRERAFPIRCTIFENSPHLSDDHQKEVVIQQRAVLATHPSLEQPINELNQSESKAAEVEPAPASLPEPCPGFTSNDVVPEIKKARDNTPQLVYTEPCEYAFNDQGGHVVVSGERKAFTRCEDEPIHTPGAIQSHGMLIGLNIVEEFGSSRYVCRVVSENCEAICKYSPSSLLQMEDFLRIFPLHQRLVFEKHARSVIALYAKKSVSTEPKVFSICFMDPEDCISPSWCAMHFVGGDHNLLICEFELDAKPDIREALLEGTTSMPYNSLNSDPSDAAASFVSYPEPYDPDRLQDEDFEADGNSMDLVNLMSKIREHLSISTNIQDLQEAIVAVTRRLTNFDRAMVYQFDEDYNGTIVAELVDPKICTDVYRGLHFPASDIPKQARQLYKLNRVRILFDRISKSSRLICRNVKDLETPLDLSHSYLRAMSPIHIKYLGNMGVRSTMSVALNYNDKLWGLIVCHSYGSTSLRVAFPIRELCYWVGLCASNCLDKLLNAEKTKQRDSLISMQINTPPREFISAASNDLLSLFHADFGFLVVRGEARTIGKLSSYHESVTLLRYVYFRKFTSTYASKQISADFADLAIEPEFAHVAGLLVIPLSNIAGDFIVFFRKYQTKKVHWAGNPNMAKFGPLEPRDSFKTWTETVAGTCQPWADEQLEAAAMIRLVYGNFIRVWRDKEASLHESRMKRLLLLNASHEVKTPLNAVVNCLEIALEKPLDQETKDILTDSHNASKSLIYVIDDLLHLTDTIYQAPLATTFDTFKLRESVLSTLHSLHIYATRKSLSFIIEWDDVMPTVFRGNLQRLQLAITQIVANAIQYTEEGGIKIHVGARPITDKDYIVHIAVQDTGTGLAEDDLDKLFQEFEQVADEDFQVTGTSEHVTTAPSSGVPKKSELGLGLALVARYIKQCGGQIRVISNMGKGSTFALDVPLTLGEEADVITPGTFAERDSNMRHGKSLSSAASTTSQPSTALVLRHAAQSPDHAPAAQSHVQDFDVVSPNDVSRATLITPKMKSLVVLVVDDNPVNVRILKRRLERMGHEVKTSLGGQECFEVFQNHFEAVECILMDINMPLVDGIQATKMIRQFETSLPTSNSTIDASTFVERSTTQLPFSPISPPPTNSRTAHDLDSDDYFALPLSPPKADTVPRYESIAPPSAPSSKADPTDRARIQGRLPIFAVSASLERHTQESLSAAGLDGWLSKPIDFKRLGVILEGVVSREARWQAKSATGDFKRGGWFE